MPQHRAGSSDGGSAEAGAPETAEAAPIQSGSGGVDSPAAKWTQLRICHLLEDVSPAGISADGDANLRLGAQLAGVAQHLPMAGVAAGLYACSPKPGAGFAATFARLHLVRGRVAGHM